MSTFLDEPAATVRPGTSGALQLRATTAAMRLAFTWFGVRRSLSSQQKAQAADTFGAEGEFLSAGKKLIDTRHPKFKAVTSIRSRAVQFWRSLSLPFPEPGIRLIKQDDVGLVTAQMTSFKADLAEAVEQLEEHYEELKAAARRRLGSLYDSGDYPARLQGLFEMDWDFPSVDPPHYLEQLSPELYRQQCQRIEARFNEAVRLAEQAFAEELSGLVSHLSERLSGAEDGKPKVFRDSAVENLLQFFQRFKSLNIGSSQQLEELVEQAQRIVRGVQPQQLRDNSQLRQEVATQMSAVQATLDGLLVDRPRRSILRRPR